MPIATRVVRFVKNTSNERVREVVRIYLDAFRRITPVDTGFLKASYEVALNSRPPNQFNPERIASPNAREKRLGFVADQLRTSQRSITALDSYDVSQGNLGLYNTAHYYDYLDNGTQYIRARRITTRARADARSRL